MHIGNRIFPYPVLNKNPDLSDYGEESSFSLIIDFDESGSPIVKDDKLILQSVRYSLNSPTLEALLEDGAASGCVVVECSPSLYREVFPLNRSGQDIVIPLSNLSGRVEVSCYLVSTRSLNGFRSDEFISLFEGMSFEVEEHDILAADDGISFKVTNDDSLDDQVSSIFTVVPLEDAEDDVISFVNNNTGITIQLPAQFFPSYDNIKNDSTLHNISFAILAIPPLASCLDEIKADTPEEIEDILESHIWFKSVMLSYKKHCGKELTLDTFLNMSSFELAQTVLNDGSCKGLHDLHEIILGAQGAGDEYDDD